jgi:hypothetical protein
VSDPDTCLPALIIDGARLGDFEGFQNANLDAFNDDILRPFDKIVEIFTGRAAARPRSA